MRIICLKALLGIFVFLVSEVPALSKEVVCTIRGKNLSGHITRDWISVTDVQYRWWVFREGKIWQGTASPDPDCPGRYLMKQAGEPLAVAGWFQTHLPLLPGSRRLRAEGYFFPARAGGGRITEGVFPFRSSISPWADCIQMR